MTDGRTDGRTDRQTDRQPWFYKTLRRTVCISLPLWQFKCLLSYWLSKNFTSATFYSYQLFCFLVSYFCTWNAPEFQINTVRLLIHKIRLTKIFKTFSSTVLPLEIYKIVFDLQDVLATFCIIPFCLGLADRYLKIRLSKIIQIATTKLFLLSEYFWRTSFLTNKESHFSR